MLPRWYTSFVHYYLMSHECTFLCIYIFHGLCRYGAIMLLLLPVYGLECFRDTNFQKLAWRRVLDSLRLHVFQFKHIWFLVCLEEQLFFATLDHCQVSVTLMRMLQLVLCLQFVCHFLLQNLHMVCIHHHSVLFLRRDHFGLGMILVLHFDLLLCDLRSFRMLSKSYLFFLFYLHLIHCLSNKMIIKLLDLALASG